ncbi:DVU0298 family protein [Desulfoferrobacter suflitae]|uniref:DVU0298 family protein n=1 Tax=Desulfoferrobacter suflitae TaxID=2865782 RepID=UPI002164A26B|nr:DVU0298 family protein [Desulfoferrobacter suflitae]MCK8603353.1 hypothetical protein [Desulfoferrobacter suflitae]
MQSSAKKESIRRVIDQLLAAPDFESRLPELLEIPARKAVNPLFAHLCDPDERVKMRAVKALGVIVGNLAEHDAESARVIMRRFMWNLNDESGCIGWGAPEALGEIMAVSEKLAREYAHVLVSYVREDGNFLEYEPLQQGVLSGLVRLAEARPGLLKSAALHIEPFLRSKNPVLRGLAARILGLIGAKAMGPEK